MKQKKKKNEVADSLSSWVMERANRMVTEYGLEQGDACRKAHLAKHIVELMGSGVVAFQYRKLNGTLRQARGTLCRDCSPEYDEALRRIAERNGEQESETQENPLDSVTYWDMDKRGWRTFLIRYLDDYERKVTQKAQK